ncbi:GDSL-type esterase/lipase family protein [Amycolatopsis arida]
MVVAAVVAVVVLVNVGPGARVPRSGPPGGGPPTVVAMGDSIMAGEGAGDYTVETNGHHDDWCHRSPHAAVHRVRLPGVTASVNLACSGAPSAHVALGDTTQWTEPSQARQLARLTGTHRISTVLVTVGANDDPRFSRLMSDCLGAWLRDQPPCGHAIRKDWRQRLAAMVPKVAAALRDVRTVLRDAGYERADYDLVLLSYPSPLSPAIPEHLRSLDGCPFHREDLRWIHGPAVESLSASLREAANRVDARFVDLSAAGRGHEACTGGDEWFTRLTVDWDAFEHVQRADHATQDSFHPNAAGHGQLARCLTEFLPTGRPAGACAPAPDGALRSGAPHSSAHPR